MTPDRLKVLLIGYGNPGRLDDGLGPALAEAIEAMDLPGVTVDADYQLTVEDAAEAARHDAIIFADADVAGPEPFAMRRLTAGPTQVSFSTHSVQPEAVVGLARDLFGHEPQAWVLGIRGYEFNEFGQRLSEAARSNLAEAVAWLGDALRAGRLEEVRASETPEPAATEKPDEDNPCKTENT